MRAELGFLAGQAWQLAAALLTGAALGCAYRGYERWLSRRRLRRRLWRPDGVFVLLAAILLLVLWSVLTDGSLRPAVFLWLALGAWAAWRLLAKPRANRRKARPPAQERAPAPERRRPGREQKARPKPGRGLALATAFARRWLLLQRALGQRWQRKKEPEEKIGNM